MDTSESPFVKGIIPLIIFNDHQSGEAYSRIVKFEPHHQYSWEIVNVEGKDANMLAGRSPKIGSILYEEDNWDGWTDPFFGPALEVIKETLDDNLKFEWDRKPLFRLQMAYLLLWSSIERYCFAPLWTWRWTQRKGQTVSKRESVHCWLAWTCE